MEITKLYNTTSIINRIFAYILFAYAGITIIFGIIGVLIKNGNLIFLNMFLLNAPYIWGILFVIPCIFMIVFTVKYAKFAKDFDRTDDKKPFLPKKIYKSGVFMLLAGVIFLIAGFVSQWIIVYNTNYNEGGNMFVNIVGILVISVVYFICLNENKDNQKGEKQPVIEEVNEEW